MARTAPSAVNSLNYHSSQNANSKTFYSTKHIKEFFKQKTQIFMPPRCQKYFGKIIFSPNKYIAQLKACLIY